MNTIEALLPVTRVFQLFALSSTQFCSFKCTSFQRVMRHYPLLLVAIRLSIFCYITTKYQLSPSEDKMHTLIDIFAISIAHFLEIIILIEAFAKACQEEMFMENFREIDSILVQHFGINLKLKGLKKSLFKRFFIWICINGIDASYRLQKRYNTRYFGQEVIWTLAYFTASLTYFQVAVWADLIRYRLRIVTCLIYELGCDCNENVDHKRLHGLKVSESERRINCLDRIENANEGNSLIDEAHILDQLGILCNLYIRLWTQTNLLNQRFKFSIVLNIGNDFVYLVAQIYFIYICLRKFATSDWLTTDISLGIVNIFHLSMLSKAGQNMANEAVQVAYAIHRNKSIRTSAKLSSFVCRSIHSNLFDLT